MAEWPGRQRKRWTWGKALRRTVMMQVDRGEITLAIGYYETNNPTYYVTIPRDVAVAILKWAVPLIKTMPSSVDSSEHFERELNHVLAVKKKRKAHPRRPRT